MNPRIAEVIREDAEDEAKFNDGRFRNWLNAQMELSYGSDLICDLVSAAIAGDEDRLERWTKAMLHDYADDRVEHATKGEIAAIEDELAEADADRIAEIADAYEQPRPHRGM